jgi:hypothetical protein
MNEIVRRNAQAKADFWREQAEKNDSRREHYEVVASQFQRLANDLVRPPWQSIETAPRDGISILVVDARVRDLWAVASWDADEPSTAKWCTLDGAYHQDRFTHWMPLPAPPVEQAKTEVEG